MQYGQLKIMRSVILPWNKQHIGLPSNTAIGDDALRNVRVTVVLTWLSVTRPAPVCKRQ